MTNLKETDAAKYAQIEQFTKKNYTKRFITTLTRRILVLIQVLLQVSEEVRPISFIIIIVIGIFTEETLS
ncbi:hypothetical protein D7274_00005, partial [Legionella pneumophila]